MEALPEIRARFSAIAECQLRLSDPAERLREPPAHLVLGERDASASELEPAQHRREVVPRGVDPVSRCGQLVVRADPVTQARCVDERDRSVAARPEMELVVFAAVQQRSVEAPDAPQPFAAQEHRRGVDEVSEEHRGKQVALVSRCCGDVGRRGAPPLPERGRAFEDALDVREVVRVVHRAEISLFDDPAVRVDRRHVGPHHPHLGVRAEHLDLCLDLPGKEGVIRVEQRDELSPRVHEAEVPCRRHTAVGLADVSHRPPVALDHSARVVRRSVVDNDDLDVVVALREHALDGRPDDPRAIVRRDYDADETRHPRPLEISVDGLSTLQLHRVPSCCRIQSNHFP